MLLSLLAHPNIASKEDIIRVYDHEVRGATVVKPLVGVHADGPSDAAVLKPLETKDWRGFVLANGINPMIGEADAYTMAISAVDEAVRNAVAVGADPSRIAILDNFCWGNPRRPEILGSLVEAARGCHDAALHYSAPFISGKDSLNNEYVGTDGQRRAIPGTLLISAIGIHPDARKAVTMDLKEAGNLVYLVGDWQPFWAGTHAEEVLRIENRESRIELPVTDYLPANAPAVYEALHAAIHAGQVRAAHDLSEGGLAVAAAEMCIGGRLGLELDLAGLHADDTVALFAETNGCLLVEVAPENAMAFEMMFEGLPLAHLGKVNEEERLTCKKNDDVVLEADISTLVTAFKSMN